MCFSWPLENDNRLISFNSDFDLPAQPMLPIPSELHVEIFNYLSVKDQVNVSLTCRYVKSVTDYSLLLRAKEYGYSPELFSDAFKVKRFFESLFKIVQRLEEERLLQNHELSFRSVTRGFLFFKWDSRKIDLEQTLINISRFQLNRLSHFYSRDNFFKIKNIELLHFLFLKKQFSSLLNVDIQKKIDERLISATLKSDTFLVMNLLKMGANPDIRNSNGETLLYTACLNWNKQIVELLLKYGAD